MIIPGASAEAMMIRTLGSGSNAIGYYMYHGGSMPRRDGDNAFFSDEAKGWPKISYDFVAPIGEFGLEHESYRTLRLIHSFLADWGSQLAPMETVLPEGWDKMTPENHDDLRYAARMKDDKGFVFLINDQDHDTNRIDQTDLQLKLNLSNETLRIPSNGTFTLPNQNMTFYFRPLRKKLPFVYRDLYKYTHNLDFSKGSVLNMKDVKIIPEYTATIKF